MSWLQKISQVSQVMDPIKIIEGVLANTIDGSGISPTQPEGGWAYQEFKKLGPTPEICKTLNYAAGVNTAARSKMEVLAEASGCPFDPASPPMDQQQPQTNITPVQPMMGEQEAPMEMPSAEIG